MSFRESLNDVMMITTSMARNTELDRKTKHLHSGEPKDYPISITKGNPREIFLPISYNNNVAVENANWHKILFKKKKN